MRFDENDDLWAAYTALLCLLDALLDALFRYSF